MRIRGLGETIPLQETGYEGTAARELGTVYSNPAIMSNRTFTILVENCTLKHGVEFDSGEDIVTRLVPVSEIPQLVAQGGIRHSLVVGALYHFDLLRRGLK